jgi:hypothetical protein
MTSDARGWSRLRTLALVGALACRTREPTVAESPTSPSVHPIEPVAGPGSNAMNRAAPSPRPPLRRLIAAHPETVARQVPADTPSRIRRYLEAHPEVPAEIAAALDAHELWPGMTQVEAELSVGPATRREAVEDVPGGFALFYAGEGWLLRFDDHGFLISLVER